MEAWGRQNMTLGCNQTQTDLSKANGVQASILCDIVDLNFALLL